MVGNKVPGWGRKPNPYMIVGEGPGRNEAIEGIPFCGASGSDLSWVFLKRAARMPRESFYITNIVKWRTDEKDSDPTPEDILRDEPELLAEIEEVNPYVIVAVGKIAASWFYMKEADMEKLHGTPIQCPRFPDKILLVTYHPAAGLRLPERYYDKIFWDFQQLGRLIRGEISAIYDEFPCPDYMWVDRPLKDTEIFWHTPGVVAMDTEGSVDEPWGYSFSTRAGFGVVGRHSTETVDCKAQILVGHHVLHDDPVIKELGFSKTFTDDTMLMAYLLPWLPRGLKALAFKLCGMEMQSYSDVVGPANEKKAREYIERVLSNACSKCGGSGKESVPYKRDPNRFKLVKCETCDGDGTNWPRPNAELVFDSNGAGREHRPRSVGRALRALLERGTDLHEGWARIDDKVRNHIEGSIGHLKEATLDDIPQETAIHYSARDADATLRVYTKLKPMLDQQGLWKVYEIDKGILPAIDRMHTNGILIDKGHFSDLEKEFSQEIKENTSKLASLVGSGVNPMSPNQVSELLFGQLKLKAPRGAEGTDEKTLETLKLKYKDQKFVSDVIDLVTDTRELSKLQGTYVIPLQAAAGKDGRVHTQFLLHVTNTGRLASRDPNLQNVPTRTERGRLIRKGFVPKPGCRLVSVDLDQIELRVAAHISEDENMMAVFNGALTCPINISKGKCNCHDIHRSTASLIYHKPLDEVSDQERLLSKTINFLILYGGSAGRLHKELNLLGISVTKDECSDYISGWLNAYPGVSSYMDQTREYAKSTGFVESLFGRRRYVQGVWSTVDKVREESFRGATNAPIQGTAADILKIWLKNTYDNAIPEIRKEGYCEPLLTVHDELIFEVEDGLHDKLIDAVVHEASSAVELLVPVGSKGNSAYDWSSLK